MIKLYYRQQSNASTFRFQRNTAYIPMPEGRGFTPLFGNRCRTKEKASDSA